MKKIGLNKIKNFMVLTLSILLCTILTGADVQPTKEFYVNDYGDVFSSSLEQHIIDTSKTLKEKTGAQVVVLSVKNLGGKDIKDYGLEVGRDWGIGEKDKDNGVLILLSVEDRKIRIEVGRGLEGCLTDGKTGELIRTYAKTDYSENNFEDGTTKLYDAVVSEVYIENNMEPIEGYDSDSEEASEEYTFFDYIVMGVFILFMLGIPILLIWIVVKAIRGAGHGGNNHHYYDNYNDYDNDSSWGSSDWDSGDGGDFGGGGSDDDF